MGQHNQDPRHGFSQVDQTNDPAYFVRFLDRVNTSEFIEAARRRSRALLNPRPGSRFLDVGCGTGEEVCRLGELVGPTGWVVGVDSSTILIAEARQRAGGLDLAVEFRVGDAHRLDFADGTFDGCRASRVLQHLADPERALTEMVRVTRSGGRVVAGEPDWETLVIDASDRALTRKILHFLCDKIIPQGWIGRQLPGLFKRLGLREVTVEPLPMVLTDYAQAEAGWELPQTVERAQAAGAVSAAEAAAWLQELEKAGRAGRFFGAGTAFLVSGQKP